MTTEILAALVVVGALLALRVLLSFGTAADVLATIPLPRHPSDA